MLIDPDYGHDPNTSIIDRASMRHDLSLIVERALDALDVLDADPDLEPDSDGEDEDYDEEDDRAADPDAARLLDDEFRFAAQMDRTRDERRSARIAALRGLANITRRNVAGAAR